MIDDKKLSAEFILPEIAALQRKTSSELEAEEAIPIINKVNYFHILNCLVKQYKNLFIITF